MKAALFSILTAIALTSTVPPSMIVSDVVQFTQVPLSTWVYSQITFGSFFTEIPKTSVILTAQEHPRLTTRINYGWIIDIQSITQTGATIALNSNNAFNYLKFKYVATQGDRLQVFKVQLNGNQGRSFISTYFQSDLVQFDSSNLPNEVFIGVQIASYVTDSDNTGLSVSPFISKDGGGKSPTTPIYYYQLKDFLSNNKVYFYTQSDFSFTSQITLLIHRVNLLTQTTVNGMNVAQFSSNYLILQKIINSPVTVGVGQGIMGVLGFNGMIIRELASATVFSVSINFTAPVIATLTLNGYDYFYMSVWGGLYVVDCHSSCETCNGVFDHNCLTCPGGIPAAANGKCGCPPHVRTFPNLTCAPCAAGCVSCSSTFNCTSCQKQKYYRVPVVDSSNLCPCLPGYYENADLSCVRCPPSQYCATCELSGTSVICTSCNCAQYREKINGACVCFSGYREYLDTPGPYCQKKP